MGKKPHALVSLFVIALCACNKTEETKKGDEKASAASPASAKSDDKDKDKDKAKTAKADGDDKAPKAKEDKAKDDEPPPKPADPPVCTVNSTKTWGKGVNTLTGLTAVRMNDGHTAIGYAVGNTPQVLVVGTKGEGHLTKVIIDKDSPFAAKVPKGPGASRAVFRVTPVRVDDKNAHAFIDFRDDYKVEGTAAANGPPLPAKARRVVCGPADSGDKWVMADYDNYLDDPTHGKDPIAALQNSKALQNNTKLNIVRDCRTFYDPAKDETWIVGSEIRLEQDAAGKVTAASALFVEQGKQQQEKPVHTTPLKTDAFKVIDYEVPISHELPDGSFLVAARVGGSALVAATLEHDKSVRGAFKTYQGFFNMPDASEDGPDDVLIASLRTGKDSYALRAMRIPGTKSELPAAFSKVTTDEDESHSESRPEFIRDFKGQRWVAYIENAEKGKGHLEIIPVNAGFRATGKPYSVTKEEEKASEARLVPQKDGGFIVVYIRDAGNGASELVTEDLDCKIAQ